MSEVIGWLITALVGALLLAFAGYIMSIARLPDKERPKTPTYNRFGEVIGELENPDYHINPGEDQADASAHQALEHEVEGCHEDITLSH